MAKYILPFIMFLFLAVSCKKEKPFVEEKPSSLDVEDSCNIIRNSTQSVRYKSRDTDWRFPVFNPNKPDEIAYVKEVGHLRSKLMIYNLATGQYRELHTISNPYGYLDWSTTGWIVFMSYDTQLWKIKEDGTGLQQLTSNQDYAAAYFPCWNPNGDKIIFSATKATFGNAYIIDASGVLLDSLLTDFSDSAYYRTSLVYGRGDWSLDNRLSAFNVDTTLTYLWLYYIDLNTRQKVYITNFGKNDVMGVYHTYWHPDNMHMVITCLSGIYKVHMLTGEITQIKPHCRKRNVKYLSINHNGSKMVTMITKARLLDDVTIEQWDVIGLIDFIKGTDVELVLP